ncbi:MAG TPA: NUDIX domain-containing protein [Rhizomicrobium sp.]|nr:NUDIX domain-containing protein [Rhizomicrobium sp.]
MALVERFVQLAQLSVRALWQPVTFGVRTILEDDSGRVVLIRHSYRSGWFLPGGGIDRHEIPEVAAERESREEAGLVKGDAPEFFGIYVQPVAWVTNVVMIYRIRNAEIDFKKSLEVRECQWADPNDPPKGTTRGTVRRLAEMTGKAAKSPRW